MRSTPPRLFLRLFRWFCHRDLLPTIEGDLLELYEENVRVKGERKARWIFRWDIIRLFRPGLIRNLSGGHRLNQYGMLRNYLIIALRVFRRERSYSLINVFGLALGFACCLLIYLFIRDELSYDRFHQDGDRIYRLSSAYMREGRWEPYASNSWRTAELFGSNFPEVEAMVRIRPMEEIVASGETRMIEDRIAVVDKSFFEIFSFPLRSGERSNVLNGTNKVVISESLATKFFGSEDPIGKLFLVDDGQIKVQVSGVMEDMPPNSHFHFDFLISGETARQFAPEQLFTNVGWDSQHVYFKARPGADIASMEDRFPGFIDANLDYLTSGNFKLFIQPLYDIHLKSNLGLEIEDNGNIQHIYIFGIVAIFILVIACINYMNLTTARSLRRSREVGARKVLGATRRNLVIQFLLESVLMTLAAILMAYFLVWLLLPAFNEFAGKAISRSLLIDPRILLGLLVALVTIGLVSGIYPSMVLSGLKPGILIATKSGDNRSIFLRRGLVTFQFVISIGLIAATVVVFKQLRFMQTKDLGINEELLINVPLQTMDRTQLDAFRNELLSDARIRGVGFVNMKLPGWISNSTYYRAQDVEIDEEARKSMKIIRVNEDFLDLLEATFVTGRNFSRDFPSDKTTALILNEAAVAQLGWQNPIGKWIELNGENYTVIGVVKDFHFESLHRKIPPTIFKLTPDYYAYAYLKIGGSEILHVLQHIENTYGQFVRDRDFAYSFVDEDIERQYLAEKKFTQVFQIFTVLAIVIASLGTFGLISFSAERKSKEIGIRKVMGASVGQITFLLTREFILMLAVASLVAWPVAYYFLTDWIGGFVYRTDIGIWPFIVAILLSILIALVTTIFRSIKAAAANPVEALRDE